MRMDQEETICIVLWFPVLAAAGFLQIYDLLGVCLGLCVDWLAGWLDKYQKTCSPVCMPLIGHTFWASGCFSELSSPTPLPSPPHSPVNLKA